MVLPVEDGSGSSFGSSPNEPRFDSNSKPENEDSKPENEDSKSQNKVPLPPRRWSDAVFVPLVFFFMFGTNLTNTPLTNLLMERSCLQHFNYAQDVCHDLANYTEKQDKVQAYTSYVKQYVNLVQLLPAGVLSVFVGPWSDKYGRTPPMYVSLVGYLLYDAGVCVWAFLDNPPIYEILLPIAIPVGLCGGTIVFLGACYSMSADSADYVVRTRRYAYMQIGVGVGTAMGTLIGGALEGVSYAVVFGAAIVSHILCALYLFVVVKDKSMRIEAPIRTKIVHFFSCENVKENLAVATRKREDNGRTQLWLLIISSAIINLNFTSIYDIMYLFCNKMYGWGTSAYGVSTTVYTVVTIVALSITIPLLIKTLKVPDSWLGLIGTISLVAENTVKAFAYKSWIFYVGLVVSSFGGIAPFAVRAKISKTVQDDELGKVFAVMTAMENIIPVPGSLLFINVYTASIGFFPGLVFLVSAGTLIFPLLSFIWLTRIPSKKYSNVVEVPDQSADTNR